jgi:ATP-binding cassette subfamily F protein uup
MPLVTLDHISHAYGHLPLLDDVSLQIQPGERLALIGRNGTGKSPFMQIVSGELTPDAGTVWRDTGAGGAVGAGRPLDTHDSVFEFGGAGARRSGSVIAAYHHASIEVAHGNVEALDRMGRLQHELESATAEFEQRVSQAYPAGPSRRRARGYALWRLARRVLLRAPVAQPDVLLLDEPTNHLDIEAIEWLKAFSPTTAVPCSSSRTTALSNVSPRRVIELDRGHLTSWPGNYATFLQKKRRIGWPTRRSRRQVRQETRGRRVCCAAAS